MCFSNCDNTLKFFDFFKMISLVFSPKNYQFYMLKQSTNLLEVSIIKVLECLKIRKDIVTLFQHSRDQSDRFLAKCFTYIVNMSCSKYLSSIFFKFKCNTFKQKIYSHQTPYLLACLGINQQKSASKSNRYMNLNLNIIQSQGLEQFFAG